MLITEFVYYLAYSNIPQMVTAARFKNPVQITSAVVLAKSPKKWIWLLFPLVPKCHLAVGTLAWYEISMKVAKKWLLPG